MGGKLKAVRYMAESSTPPLIAHASQQKLPPSSAQFVINVHLIKPTRSRNHPGLSNLVCCSPLVPRRPYYSLKPLNVGVDYDSVGIQVAAGDELLWQGTTWPMSCVSPLCCSEEKWRITQRRIDIEHGCYHTQADTVDMRRVKDLAFRRTPLQLICGRGTVKIYSDSHLGGQEQKPLSLTRMGARRLYLKIRKVRLASSHPPSQSCLRL